MYHDKDSWDFLFKELCCMYDFGLKILNASAQLGLLLVAQLFSIMM